MIHHETKAEAIRTYRLDQGHRNRWVVAWSFDRSQGEKSGIYGEEIKIEAGNVDLNTRIKSAFRNISGYTSDTGICGGKDFNFRIRVNQLSDCVFSVDILDRKGNRDQATSIKRQLEKSIENND